MTLVSLSPRSEAGLRAQIRNSAQYENLDLESEPFPAQITGTLTAASPFSGDVVIAISLNGRIEAVVRTYDTEGSTTSFQAMLPPEAFRAGANHIEVVLVTEISETRSYSLARG